MRQLLWLALLALLVTGVAFAAWWFTY